MIVNKKLVKRLVVSEFVDKDISIRGLDISSIVDSILFDWNELDDKNEDIEQLVSWNVDQFISHNTDGDFVRITNNEARENKMAKFSFADNPSYSNETPSAFTLSNPNDGGWQKVTYWK